MLDTYLLSIYIVIKETIIKTNYKLSYFFSFAPQLYEQFRRSKIEMYSSISLIYIYNQLIITTGNFSNIT